METGEQRVDLSVSGMTCAACQANVQRVLRRQPGVADATVNLLTGEARVTIDPSAVQPSRLVSAVEAIGYTAAIREGTGSPAEPDDADAARLHEAAHLTRRAFVAGVLGVIAMIVSMPLMAGGSIGHGPASAGDPVIGWTMTTIDPVVRAAWPALYEVPRTVLTWALLAVTLFVMTWAGGHLFTRGLRALWHGVPDMNSLVAIGTGAAFVYSAVATVWPPLFTAAGISPDVYYEAVIIIVALVLGGRAIEARATRRTADAVRALASLQPSTATVLEAGAERRAAIDAIQLNAIVLVRPGERVPLDGHVIEGTAAVDEAMLTGEAVPVVKQPGDPVTGGTIVSNGALRFRVTRTVADGTLAQIVRLMRQAQTTRAPIQQLADRVSRVFVPGVMGISAITVAVWLSAGGGGALVPALAAGVAVLIIACPCAMGLAVPTAVMVATGRAGQAGILIKGGAVLQRAAEVTLVVLDKTGTLTEGRPSVTAIVTQGLGQDRVLTLAAAAEAASEHPLGEAIVRAAVDRGLTIPAAASFRQEPGKGIAAAVAGVDASGNREDVLTLVGNRQWVREHAEHADEDGRLEGEADRLAREGVTPVFVAVSPHRGIDSAGPLRERASIVGVLGISDPIRSSSPQVVAALQARGLEVIMLTGDRAATAEAVARRVGVGRVLSEVLPQGKVEAVRALQRDGHVVAMVGDGVNDAAALAQADVGVAMGSGTDIALEAADVALVRSDLAALVTALDLSRAAMRTMKQNLFWAFAYNVVGIPVAAGVLYPAFGILLSPVLASAAMAVSSISVVMNSLRLKGVRA